jgi:hypothetical protein
VRVSARMRLRIILGTSLRVAQRTPALQLPGGTPHPSPLFASCCGKRVRNCRSRAYRLLARAGCLPERHRCVVSAAVAPDVKDRVLSMGGSCAMAHDKTPALLSSLNGPSSAGLWETGMDFRTLDVLKNGGRKRRNTRG